MQNIKKKYIFIAIFALLLLFSGIALLCFDFNSKDTNAATCNVYFNADGGECEFYELENVETKSTITLPQITKIKTGYTFECWTIFSTGGSYVDVDGYTYKLGTKSDYSFKAKWTPITYEVVYIFNDDDQTQESESTKYDSYFFVESDYDVWKENYVFLGWTLIENSQNVMFRPREKVKNLTTINNSYVYLYGVWGETYLNGHYAKPQGSGIIDNPYLISNDKELAWMSYYTREIGDLEGYFKQTADIDLGAYEWYPIGTRTVIDYTAMVTEFIGNYDGCGHSIKNMRIRNTFSSSYSNRQVGLFGKVSDSVISNLVIASGEISLPDSHPADDMGSIVGYASNTKIVNCSNFIDIETRELGHVGGIVGDIYGSDSLIQNCQNYGNISGGSMIGGISGNRGLAINCYAECNLIPVQDYKISNYDSFSWHVQGISLKCENSIFKGYIKAFSYEEYHNLATYSLCGSSTNNKNIVNCYAKISTNLDVGLLKKTGTNIIFEINGEKYYSGTDFSAFGLIEDKRICPKSLSWQAQLSPALTIQKLQAMGYVEY